MNLFSRADFKTILGIREWPCVSLFIPTYYAGPQVMGNIVRFKKLLSEAESRVVSGGMSAPKAAELFRDAKSLLDDAGFWQHQLDGFVLFLSPGLMLYHKLPVHFDERLVVSDRFYVKPILPVYTNTGNFYVVSLGKSIVRLYRASRFEINELELEGVPRGIAEAMRLEEHQKLFSFHEGPGPSIGGSSHQEIRHGAGSETDYHKDEILRYFQMVDAGVQKVVQKHPGAVVLAGVEYLQAIYRDADGKLDVVDDWLDSNPEAMNLRELHQRSWNIVAPIFRREQQAAASLFLQLANRGNGNANGGGNGSRAPSDLGRILVASRDGRVQYLFVPLNAEKWGRFDPQTGESRFDDAKKDDSEDLFERAAVQTISTGGTVYAVQPEEMPGRKPIAAVLRY